jgi:hypothetical protein
MQYAMMLPMNQAHTAVAGPPELIGAPKVAGTEPSTPRIEMAYETVDHLEKCLCNTCRWSEDYRVEGLERLQEYIQYARVGDRRRLRWLP